MKKIVLLLTMLVGLLEAQANDYTYLKFETTDGTINIMGNSYQVTWSILRRSAR